jgi:hypothetical protein
MLDTAYTSNMHNTICCTHSIVQGCLGCVMIALSKEFTPQSKDMSVISRGETFTDELNKGGKKRSFVDQHISECAGNYS